MIWGEIPGGAANVFQAPAPVGLRWVDSTVNLATTLLACQPQVPDWTRLQFHTLEAFAVDNGRAALVVLLLGDPHLLEGRQGRKDRATDPDRVLALGRSNDLDLHGGRGERRNLLLHAVGDTRVHGGTTGLGKLIG